MTKIFYDHLIIVEEITEIVDAQNISPSERSAILTHVDELFHNAILDVILTHLPKKDHETFLHTFAKSPDSKELMKFLQERTTVNVEKAIVKRADSIKKIVYRLLEESKKAGQTE